MADLSFQAAAYDTIKPDNSLVMGCWWIILLLWLLLNLSFIANWYSLHAWCILCCGQILQNPVNPLLLEDAFDPSKSYIAGNHLQAMQVPCLWQFLWTYFWARESFVVGKIFQAWTPLLQAFFEAKNLLSSPSSLLEILSPSSMLGILIQALINGSLVT